jgi:mRNA interferase MazF
MKKGEIWMEELNPVKGSEQSGQRPVIIVSGNALNDHFDLVITCPLSSKVKNFPGNIILQPDNINGIKEKSEILVFQIRTISKQRLKVKLGNIGKEDMSRLEENLLKILRY